MEKFGEFTGPTTSKNKPQVVDLAIDPPKEPFWVKCIRYAHDSQAGTYCGRTGKSWILIIIYAIIYLIFLSTYTMIFLYCSILIIKTRLGDTSQTNIALFELFTYPETGVGLTGTPTNLNDYPLIWYREGVNNDYEKYIRALDAMFANHRTERDVAGNLGPCAKSPYGYGDKPCVIIKINKQYKWAESPLESTSPQAGNAPDEVQKWMQVDSKKYWLHCSGYHSYDKEHIGNIQYYPDPPGFDSKLFPVRMNATLPMIAIQIVDFTYGISLAIQCKLWYDKGVSTLNFILYVMPKQRHTMTRTIAKNMTQ
ncbi:sodium/potassium-transporting ATPase subunit beta-1-like [Hyposmocoma kahamanoa]|uniref:sodium/potassium-transporting ATPase subunit beta-1-like n=1 Tax=Hyposmocoma kahamanoa TaxID=1477025 RepID=UPI000E6D7DBF|nr:sodium/potassium-transporting ATPase subunit beta-1-like [Hyposmocoma kahamanoa]